MLTTKKFLEFVDNCGYSDNPEDCWIWEGALSSGGYGSMTVGWGVERTHRLSWLLSNGPIPDGLYVLHRCDVRLCCNPKHLFLGTQKDNMQDMYEKGRAPDGRSLREYVESGCRQPKLSPEDILGIRARRGSGEKLASIAKSYGVSISHIHNIVKGKIYQ